MSTVGAFEQRSPAATREPNRALEAFRAELREHHARLRGEGLLGVLGLGDELVDLHLAKDTYRTLKERFSPERFAGQLSTAERGMLREIDLALDRAFCVLTEGPREHVAPDLLAVIADASTAELIASASSDAERAHVEWVRGERALAAGDLSAARARFTECVRLDPDEARYHFRLGQTLLRLHGEAGAINSRIATGMLENAVELDPDNVEYVLELARLWKRKGRFDASIDYYERALYLDPGQREAQREIRLHAQRLAQEVRGRRRLFGR